MIDINILREDPENFKKSVARKGYKLDVDSILVLDSTRRDLIGEIEALRKESNEIAAKGKDIKDEDREKGKDLKEKIKVKEEELKGVESQLNERLSEIPNPPADDVPDGKSEEDNVVTRTWGDDKKEKSFKPKDHIEIGKTLDIIDTEKAADVVGSRFAYLKGEAAMLELALINFVFETLTSEEVVKEIADSIEKGYSSKPFTPVLPPVMIRPEVFKRMGRLSEADKDERYYLEKDDLYLIGSAEHTLGPLHMDEVLKESSLPIRYIGFSTSFRREAGSYGKDVRGILRVHQFDKAEMESFTTSEDSVKEQNFFVAIQEYFMQKLEIPYEVMMISTGDMGGPDYRQIDINSWIPSQNKYRETHTSDLMTDYQSRRLNIKVKKSNGEIEYAHMNDATAIAIGRTLIAILENYQNEDGSVDVPKALHKYLSFKKITPKD